MLDTWQIRHAGAALPCSYIESAKRKKSSSTGLASHLSRLASVGGILSASNAISSLQHMSMRLCFTRAENPIFLKVESYPIKEHGLTSGFEVHITTY